MTTTKKELATILAALRIYQQTIEMTGVPPADVYDIASDCRTFFPMEAKEIDGLCERLNGTDDLDTAAQPGRHKFELEYDGSLVCDRVVVVQPSEGFPKSAITQLVRSSHYPDSVLLLEKVLHAINQIPNTSLHGEYGNTYRMAATLEHHLKGFRS